MKQLIRLTINDEPFDVPVTPTDFLVDVIREQVGLTGTKKGCGIGDCGACTVLIDGLPALACLTLALSVEGKKVTTIEGLSQGPELHPVQQAFADAGAVQCGFCTPGMILSAATLLERIPNPTEEQIRTGLSGNLCRCTGYVKIVDAVQLASELMASGPTTTKKREADHG